MNEKDLSLYNRDISWLKFNARVLQEAEDPDVPLIERIRFLGIHSNNMDEFFRVRYSFVRRLQLSTVKNHEDNLEGHSPGKLLKQLSKLVNEQQQLSQKIYEHLRGELAKESIEIISEQELTQKQAQFVRDVYRNQVSPALTNLMLSQAPEFPYLRDKGIYLAVRLMKGDSEQFSIIEVPSGAMNRFIALPKYGKQYIMYLDDVLRYNLSSIFHIFNYDSIEAHTVKITRDAELTLDDDVSKSFMEKVQKGLLERREGDPVRFVYDRNISEVTLNLLVDGLGISEFDGLIAGGRYHNKKDLVRFPNVGGPSLEHKKLPIIPHPALDEDRSIISVLKKQDVLLFTPYHDFGKVIRLLREAAIDPKVRVLKVTLYRLASQSRIISALVNAAKNGKDVTVFIELQARFDEANNIKWTNMLRAEGIKVVSGVPGLKVHSKLTLIRRDEGKEKLVDYCVVGTGNYHEGTAKIYTDYHLLTSKKQITKEVRKVFTFIESPYKQYNYKHLLVSPNSTREGIFALIDREIAHARAGREAKFWVKINSVSDHEMIAKLYEASASGVSIRMIVRGINCIDFSNKALSGTIEAISIVDRFLEHTRAFCFHNNGQSEYYISSADWMTRNLNRRVEVTVPIYDDKIKRQLRDHFEILWKDNTKSRIFDANQSNAYRKLNGPKIRAQLEMHAYVKKQLLKG
ncbi:polyphosphate kinase 1 [Schleiferiaceae bacterium]|jgi:polyphosphate kinase|nr:polyphosphate kinase 1 [Schleiferiaceae bacterium]MDA8661646.1 polyphosphate kinase 1 [Schleiferiaceae bacterium]MDB2436664.1 polyphosphate kinase 1 [Schleiferiaceae bacterium]